MLIRHKRREATMLEALREVFGFQAFRPNQEAIVKSILVNIRAFGATPRNG